MKLTKDMFVTNNRLRFVHCDHVFESRQAIEDWVNETYKYQSSLYGEPTVFKYKESEDAPINLILAIGVNGTIKENGEYEDLNTYIGGQWTGIGDNKTFFIDIAQSEKDIKTLKDIISKDEGVASDLDKLVTAIKDSCGFDKDGKYQKIDTAILSGATTLSEADEALALAIYELRDDYKLDVEDTSSLDLSLESKEGDAKGLLLKGEVKVPDTNINALHEIVNNTLVKTENGLFHSVDLTYNEENGKVQLILNKGIEGKEQIKDIDIPVDVHIVKGFYNRNTECLELTLNRETDIKVFNKETKKEEIRKSDVVEINLGDLIDEWRVASEDFASPIVLHREPIHSQDSVHGTLDIWQDVLSADVRIDNTREHNILAKTSDGKALFVDGEADNIVYRNTTVAERLDNTLYKQSIADLPTNIITLQNETLYASVKLDYIQNSNTLRLITSDKQNGEIYKDIKLNSPKLFESAHYDSSKEVIVISYLDGNNELQTIEIPISVALNDLKVDNTNRTVTLDITYNNDGDNFISADVNVADTATNILKKDKNNNTLYVEGTASNISFNGSNVDEALRTLIANLNTEINRAKEVENTLSTSLDTLTKDNAREHESINLKIDTEIERSTRVDELHHTRIENEINRAKEAENHIKETFSGATISLQEKDIELQGQIDVLKTSYDGFVKETEASISKLNTDLSNEITRSIEKDSELSERINAYVNSLDNETTAREAEDAALGQRITSLDNKYNHLITDVQDDLKLVKSNSELSDKKHDERLDSLEGKVDAIGVVSTPTLNLTMTNGKISGKVVLDGNKNNIISGGNGAGLFASVDLQYDSATNTLRLLTNGVPSEHVIRLNAGSLVDSISYDKDNGQIIINYTDAQGNKQSTSIDVRDLFNEWTVENSDSSAVILNKTLHTNDSKTLDVLTADVKISADAANILQKVDGGYLMVSNESIVNNAQAIETEKNRAEGVENKLAEQITATNGLIVDEVTRAKEVEKQLTIDEVAGEAPIIFTKETSVNGGVKLTSKLQLVENNNLLEVKDGALFASTSADKIKLHVGEEGKEISVTAKFDELASQIADSGSDTLVAAKEYTDSQIEIAKGEANQYTDDAVQKAKEDVRNEIAVAKTEAIDESKTYTDAEIAKTKTYSSFNTVNTKSLTLTKVDYEDKASELSGEVKINTVKVDNILDNSSDDGLYANVTLDYDGATNKLRLIKSNGKEDAYIQLNAGALVDDVVYDNVNRTITIKYTTANNQSQEVTIDVKDLFNEWTVATGKEYNIELEKIDSTDANGKDILKANVKIKSGSDNLLQTDVDSGSLFVSHSAITSEITEYADNKATDTLNAAKEYSDTQDTRLETVIDGKIATAKSDAIDAAKTYTDEQISDVYTRGTAYTDKAVADATKSLEDEIKSAKDEAIAAVATDIASLKTQVASNASEITSLNKDVNDLSDDLNKEVQRATTAESDLSTKITTAADNAKTYTDSEIVKLANATDEKIANSSNVVTEKINTLETKVDGIKTTLDTTIDNVKSDVQNVSNDVATLRTDLTAEVLRSTNVDSVHDNQIATLSATTETIAANATNLATKVEALEKTTPWTVSDTPSVELVKSTTDSGASALSANVRKSAQLGNQLGFEADGLFYKLDVQYNKASNVLSFNANGTPYEIQLNSVSTIQDISYDSENDRLVLKYATSDGTVNTVFVPVADFFRQFEAKNDGKNVEVDVTYDDTLKKYTISANMDMSKVIANGYNTPIHLYAEDNLLKAELLIDNEREHNLLKTDGNNNSLYVEGTAKSIYMDGHIFGEGVLDNVDDVLRSLNDTIKTNKTEADFKFTQLDEKITEEKNRAEKAEKELADDIRGLDTSLKSIERFDFVDSDFVVFNKTSVTVDGVTTTTITADTIKLDCGVYDDEADEEWIP